jgi:hypothetical protein
MRAGGRTTDTKKQESLFPVLQTRLKIVISLRVDHTQDSLTVDKRQTTLTDHLLSTHPTDQAT